MTPDLCVPGSKETLDLAYAGANHVLCLGLVKVGLSMATTKDIDLSELTRDLENYCITCKHHKRDHDPEYDGMCTYGCHGYTCACKAFDPAR